MTTDLEAVLEPVSAEFPALFSEFLYANQRDDLPFRMGGVDNNAWCWVVAQNVLHLWNLKPKRSVPVNRSYTLNLIPNGRHYNAQDIVVYERADGSLPGVMAVSSNGTVRHWRNLNGQFSDTQLQLNAETLLSIAILEPSTEDTSARVMLTTTVGSVYVLVDDGTTQNGRIDCNLLASYTNTGSIGSRLSMFFRQSDINDKRALKSLAVIRRDRPASKDLVVVGPGHFTVFDPKSVQPSWTAEPSALLGGIFTEYFQRQISARGADLAQLKVFLLDVAHFRGGILLMAAATLPHSKHPTIALASYSQLQELQTRPDWFAVVPLGNPSVFDAHVESSFVGQLSLFVPREIGNEDVMAYDGCVIMHDTFAQAIHPSPTMQNLEIPVNRAVFFPEGDRFIGQGCDDRQTFVFLMKKGICSIRLLPRGFTEAFPAIDKVYGSAEDMAKRLEFDGEKMKNASEDLNILLSAFRHFSSRRLKESSATLCLLGDQQLVDATHRFLDELIDDHSNFISGHYNSVDHQLTYRQMVVNRFVFFVKAMQLEQTLGLSRSNAKLGSMLSRGKSGTAVLTEAVERITAAVTLRKWQLADEDQKTLLEYVSRRTAVNRMLQDNNTVFVFLQELSFFHHLPDSIVQLVREKLTSLGKLTERMELLRIGADCLTQVVDAIEKERRTINGMGDVRVADRWTTGEFSDSLQEMVILTLTTILESASQVTVMQRKSAVEQMRKLLFFALSDSSERPEGNDAILLLYNIEETDLATDIAERFKDFKLLIKIALNHPKEKSQKMLSNWKTKFAGEQFDMYLCNYYRQRGMNDRLLEERGPQADNFIAACEDLRWRREIDNAQYAKAAQSLMSLGDRVDDPVRKEGLFVFAKLAALCVEGGNEALLKKAQEKHRMAREELGEMDIV